MASSLIASFNDIEIRTDSPQKSDRSTKEKCQVYGTISGRNSSGDSFLDTFFNSPCASVRTEPMIEVYSIRVLKNSFVDDHEDKCQVYGTITVVDSKTNIQCLLYNRGRTDENPDVISFDYPNLTLNRTNNVFAMEQPIIIFDIRDTATDAAIIAGRACLENATTAEFEQNLVLTIHQEGVGSVYVDYTALRFGVAASLDLRLQKYVEDDSNDGSDSDEESVDVCGSILACHSNAYCSRKSASQIRSTKVFETQASESQVVEFGSPIKLSRQFVAVPAYSSLVIKFNLRDPDTDEAIFVGETTVETDNYESSTCVLGESCRSYKMLVEVRWKEPFMLDESFYDTSSEPGDGFAKLGNGMVIATHPLVEIFSVFIGRQNCEEELSLYGKIVFYNVGYSCTVFEATEEDPYRLPSGCNTILLNGPSRTMPPEEHFCIFMELVDVKGRIHIKGCAESSYGVKEHHKSWHDKWLCSIVKGAQENGFAALNYMVMPYAVKSVVKVKFFSKGTRVFRDGLHGKIVALYDKYSYETDDVREYNQTVLFKRSEDKCFIPNGDNTEVELSRTVVPVPMKSSLAIQVQLKFGRDSVDEILWFEPWGDDSSYYLEGGSFSIGVSVEWRWREL
ncbi:uncharacterized protein LOC141592692 isoform X2 [Silene latifolia]|uniref:uncharacterized protein LOC141592692 isoform X2 n=1 Tax=Silene latifolia TaxID=37657 RepID=UPI003D778790